MIGKFFKDYSGFLLSAGVDFPGTLIPDVELIVFGASHLWKRIDQSEGRTPPVLFPSLTDAQTPWVYLNSPKSFLYRPLSKHCSCVSLLVMLSNPCPLPKNKCRSVVSESLWPHGLYSSWNSPGQKTAVGSLSLLQGIFPTQGSNPGLQHCKWILYQLSHQGSPRILEWVAYPFFRGSSWPRNQKGVSCIAGRFLTNWAIREALISLSIYIMSIQVSTIHDFKHLLWFFRKHPVWIKGD